MGICDRANGMEQLLSFHNHYIVSPVSPFYVKTYRDAIEYDTIERITNLSSARILLWNFLLGQQCI
ncbi:hypothetical protein Patl1_17883 [Pistacia atlantica]|uniref:Uncharacterized protein n=1 Tax=Pistacia atlantica TaxID=434234 RepID=A0ACC1C2N8_9ROSI|nr:hypothetical protein Patl1_17883 [Pistacia atlantica]